MRRKDRRTPFLAAKRIGCLFGKHALCGEIGNFFKPGAKMGSADAALPG